ncbi:MAG TPA: family 78 glycoside hydrolase catalytic domain [Verrucomicrobiae bacterium]|nr:family 78 glycoside hydrolase catalytic domain [Verrucomicrobiae bacterium]
MTDSLLCLRPTVRRSARLAIVALGLVLSWRAAFGAVLPTALQCEYSTHPLGVDVVQPRLSWQVASSERDQRQGAYEILVASSLGELARDKGDLWDSGKVASSDTLFIPYQGRALKSSQPAFWKVRVWDGDDQGSAWSEPATWTMGVLSAADWQAQWIGAANTNLSGLLVRREFTVKPGLKRALVHLCGLGQYELSLNGRKAGDDLLAPGWTKYDRTCLYDTRDVTDLLRPGTNAVGMTLGDGMYRVLGGGRYTKFKGSFGPLKVIAQVRLEYADGSVQTFGTDAQWRVNPGPLTFTSIYGGEDFDARRQPAGWNTPGFDDAQWERAVETTGPGGMLRGLSCAAPPLRAMETLRPVSEKELTNGVAVYDLGQNAPIMPRLTVQGPAGSSVRITPAELLKPDGSVDRRSAGGGEAYWQYTLAGGAEESWFPQFFYQGCRYLQVERLPAAPGGERPRVVGLAGVVVHSSSRPVGEFSCANGLFNRIHTLIRWAQRANMVSVLTDCPHRERLGWLEQYHLNGLALRYEFDLAQLFAKGMNDMQDSQLPNGMVPSIAPEYVVFGKGPDDDANAFRNSPEWGSAIVLVPWQQYQFAGDTALLRRHYDAMKRYVAYLNRKASFNILDFGLGDWYDLGPKPPGFSQLTPRSLTATAFYFYDTWILSQTAQLLGRAEEAKQFADQADEIRAAFNAKFYNRAQRSYATGSQCANAIPLVMNLCEPENRAAVLAALVRDVQSRGDAITAGDVGYRYLLRALADGGRSDLIFAMNNQTDKPGYGYQLKKGATSLTEAWDARPSSSQNHFMLGQIMEWFYGDLAGIAPDPDGPGFKRIIIRPQPVGNVTWAKASYDSVRGPVACAWKRTGRQFALDVVIPANATATVYVPATDAGSVREGGFLASGRPGVKFLRSEGDRAVLHIGSGEYRFTSDWQPPGRQ